MGIRQDAEKDAQRLLETVWAEDGAESIRIPVDPVVIARRLGVDAFAAQLERDVAAAIVKRPGKDPTILLNDKDSEVRQRFSCAHELGHFVRRTNNFEDTEEFEYIDFRDGLARDGTDAEEIYANNFAGALLMPAANVRELRRAGMQPAELAFTFQVSADAMNVRLQNLGLAG